MDTLLESIVLCRQGSFHRSKMVLWTYFHHHTSRLFHLAKWQEFSTSLLLCVQTCHNQKRMLSSSQIQSTSNAESVTIAVTLQTLTVKVLVQQDILCSQRGICLRSNDVSVCEGQPSHSSSVFNNPFLLV